MRRHLYREIRGNAIAEFAVMVPLVVLMIYYTLFINDLTIYRIKSLDVSRFAAFGFADRMGSNYVRSNPGSATNSNRSEVKKQLVSIWGDLDPSTMDDTSTNWEVRRSAEVRLYARSSDMKNGEAPLVVGDGMDAIQEADIEHSGLQGFLSSFSGVLATVYGEAGFNTKGMMTTTIDVRIRNKLIPTAYHDKRFTNPSVPANLQRGISMSNRLAMLTDSWKLEDGRDVQGDHRFKDRVIQDSGMGYEWMVFRNNSPFHKQVKRMWLCTFDPADSVGDLFGSSITGQIAGSLVGMALDWILSLIPGQPFNTRVVSHAYKDNAEDGMIDVYDVAGLTYDIDAVKKHHTAPMEDQFGGKSEYRKVFDKRGDYYMGCTSAQDEECEWAR